MRLLVALAASLVAVAASDVGRAAVPVYTYEVVHTYPHDVHAFTEGLLFLNGVLYESTGLEGHSSIRKVQLESGRVLQKIDVAAQYFGEGIVVWKHELISLTWKSHVGFVFDLATLELRRRFHYQGEGWALTQDGKRLIMSDGTADLRFLDPRTLRETGRLHVSLDGRPITQLNELEYVKGEIFANVWQTDWLARIDPGTGQVLGLIDLSGLLALSDRVPGQTDVLNGIAYDDHNDRLFVTGKNWPHLFEIRVKPTDKMAQMNH
jgi:glutaminyl-peptide cyclotransferase